MAGYVIANYRVTNPEGYAKYGPAVVPTIAAYGAEVLVVDPQSEAAEGEPANVMIVLKFPSKDAARAWYNSPEYQAIIHLRQDNTEGFLAFADGWVAP